MNTPTSSAVPAKSGNTLRWKTGLSVLALCVGGTVVVNRAAENATDRMIATFMGIGVSVLVLSFWWLLFSGVKLRTRFLAWLLSGAALAVFAMCVRNVWFEGDMRPHFEFRWDPPSARQKAQEWLAQQKESPKPKVQITEPLEITAADWPDYCGPGRNRMIMEPAVSFDWKASPPRELWRHPVGDAWSSFSGAGPLIFTQEQRGELECTVCYLVETGEEVWRREDKARYESAQGAVGPRATPVVTPTAIYALGATGILTALKPSDGTVIWQRNILDDAGAQMIEWGMSGTPLIDGDRLFVDAGGNNGKAVIAYDRNTGDILWAKESHTASYTAPRIEEFSGIRHLLIFHGEGLLALDPETGKRLWEYPWTNQYKINVAQPIRFNDSLFISSGYNAGCVMLNPGSVADGRPAEVWAPAKSMKLKFNEAVRLGDYLYGIDDGILSCIDLNDGKRKWKGGRYGFGHVLLWSDKLIVQAEEGYVAVVDAIPDKFKEVTRFEALNDRTWNVPVVNQGRLLVRNASEAACFDLTGRISQPASATVQNAAEESKAEPATAEPIEPSAPTEPASKQ